MFIFEGSGRLGCIIAWIAWTIACMFNLFKWFNIKWFDIFNGYGYLNKGLLEALSFKRALELNNLNSIEAVRALELGITWFLFFYTTAGMYLPSVAYLIMFRRLLMNMKKKEKKKWIYWFYMILSIPPFTPFIVICR